MYKAFYGLREKPFNLTPDPRFLYLSEKHKEAFAHLLYGIRNRAGFVMVTGEIGTGKTTICRNLLNQLDEDTELAFIFNPMLSPLELLKKIVSEFGIEARGTNALELTEELNEYLLEAAAKGKNCVLLIDEAQNLDPQVLEQIRLLSNLETETEKLLQIVLIGQPELGEKLALHELRQLNQRITARYHLKPLSDKEVLHYVAYRLHVAGGRRQVKFARRAIKAVYKISKGTPRVINALCDRALLIGFTREVRVITPGIVHRAHREIRGDAIFGKKKPRWTMRQLLLNPVAAIALLCVGAAIYLNSPALQARGNALATRIVAALPKATEAPAEVKAENVVADPGAVPAPTAATSTTVPTDAPAPQTTTTAAAPPVPPAAPLTQTFEATLAAVPKSESDAAALALMCQAWGKAVPAKLPELSSDVDLEAFVQSQSWSHDRLNPALDQLLALDLPAFVKVIAGDSSRWVTLSKAEGDNLTVSINASAPATVNRSEFQRVYAAEAVVPWQDSLPGAAVLRQGQQAPAVALLKEKLQRLNRLRPENTTDTFDVETASAVARIQAETSLDVDGIAGKQFRMVMSSWLKEDGAPSLTGKVAPAPAPPRQALASTEAPAAATQTKPEPKPETKAEPKSESKPEPKPKPVIEAEPVVVPAPVVAEPPVPAAETPAAPTPVEAAPVEDAAPAVTPEAPPAAPVTLTNIGEDGPKAPTESTEPLPEVTAPAAAPGPQPTNPLDPTSPPPAIEAPAPATLTSGLLAVEELSDPGQLFIPDPPAMPAPVEGESAAAAPAEENAPGDSKATPLDVEENKG